VTLSAGCMADTLSEYFYQ